MKKKSTFSSGTVCGFLGRKKPVLAIALATLALLAGCSPSPPVEGDYQAAATDAFGHVHGIDVDSTSGEVFVATHFGIFAVARVTEDSVEALPAEGPIAGREQDAMGFVMHDGVMFASGHPDPAENLELPAPNLGLMKSTDHAETWDPIAFYGEVDFHDLAVAEGEYGELWVYGYSAGGVYLSTDSGETWIPGAVLALRDLAVDQSSSEIIYATTQEGLQVSVDSGQTFVPVEGSPPLYLIETTESGLVGLAADGTIWFLEDGSWESAGAADGDIHAMAYVSGPTPALFVADSRGVVATLDKGITWDVLAK